MDGEYEDGSRDASSRDALMGASGIDVDVRPCIGGRHPSLSAGDPEREMKGPTTQQRHLLVEALREAVRGMQRECASMGMPCLPVQGESTEVRPLRCDEGQYDEPKPDGEEPERLELGWVVVRSRRGRRVGSAERVAVRDSSRVVGGRTVSIEDGFGSHEGEAPPPPVGKVVPQRRLEPEPNRFSILEVEVSGNEDDGRPEIVSQASTPTKTVVHWRRRKAKRLGTLASHARFLQYVFRRTRRVRPGCWSRGGMKGLLFYRPVTRFACMDGQNLAPEGMFVQQQEKAAEVLAWYRQYVELLRRLRSGRTPSAVVGFSGKGGVSEGVRRAGGASNGQDIREQPRYLARFGPETFSCGDSRSPAEMRRLKRATGSFILMGSPPCKAHSTSLMRGKPSEEAMIAETRAAYLEVGGLYAIENVLGASSEMSGFTSIRGQCFGLHVDRCRCLNYALRMLY